MKSIQNEPILDSTRYNRFLLWVNFYHQTWWIFSRRLRYGLVSQIEQNLKQDTRGIYFPPGKKIGNPVEFFQRLSGVTLLEAFYIRHTFSVQLSCDWCLGDTPICHPMFFLGIFFSFSFQRRRALWNMCRTTCQSHLKFSILALMTKRLTALEATKKRRHFAANWNRKKTCPKKRDIKLWPMLVANVLPSILLEGTAACFSTNQLFSFFVSWSRDFPTDPFSTFELQNPWHYVPELRMIHRYPDLEALKSWRGRSGSGWAIEWAQAAAIDWEYT